MKDQLGNYGAVVALWQEQKYSVQRQSSPSQHIGGGGERRMTSVDLEEKFPTQEAEICIHGGGGRGGHGAGAHHGPPQPLQASVTLKRDLWYSIMLVKQKNLTPNAIMRTNAMLKDSCIDVSMSSVEVQACMTNHILKPVSAYHLMKLTKCKFCSLTLAVAASMLQVTGRAKTTDGSLLCALLLFNEYNLRRSCANKFHNATLFVFSSDEWKGKLTYIIWGTKKSKMYWFSGLFHWQSHQHEMAKFAFNKLNQDYPPPTSTLHTP